MHYNKVLLSVTHLRLLAVDLQPKHSFETIDGTGWPAVSGLRHARMDANPITIAETAFESLVTVKQTLVAGRVADAETRRSPDAGRVCNVSTGFVVAVSGELVNYVVTTAKAVGNAKYVTLSKLGTPFNRRCFVKYREPERDLALIVLPEKVAMKSAVEFVDKDVLQELKATRDVLTVTCAETYTSVTSGIVVHRCRTGDQIIKIAKTYGFITPDMKYIQHTAAFPFDTSGSPLIDLKSGKVLGVSFYQQRVDGVPLYFAIPSYEIQ
ncbi:unnamed protein product, partial [Medioppia subpectinata]